MEHPHLNIFEILALANEYAKNLQAQDSSLRGPSVTGESSITHQVIPGNPRPPPLRPPFVTAPPVATIFTEGNMGETTSELFNDRIYDVPGNLEDFKSGGPGTHGWNNQY